MEKLTKEQKEIINNGLYEICDSVHASCNSSCPVYDLRSEEERASDDCPYFKNGEAMRKFLEKHGKVITIYYEPKIRIE